MTKILLKSNGQYMINLPKAVIEALHWDHRTDIKFTIGFDKSLILQEK